eukprot:1176824-Karenia_brevis.AAC.1
MEAVTKELDEELVKNKDDVKDIHNRNRKRLGEVMSDLTRAIDQELEELEISRGKSIESIQRIGD